MPISNLHQLFLRLTRKAVVSTTQTTNGYTHTLWSAALRREVRVDVYLPAKPSATPLRLFCFNDGQDLIKMPIGKIMQQLIAGEKLPPFMLVGIHADKNRMQEYGTMSSLDYAGRGKKAEAYGKFITKQLLPYLNKQYSPDAHFDRRAIAGFSLGGLAAFDLAWHFPQYFGLTGVFSGALWWRSQPFAADDPDAHRIIHTQVEQAAQVPSLKCWFQAGTLDEKEDRNNNGVIDAIDDTLDLIKALEDRGFDRQHDLHYHQVEGGRHNPKTWAKVLPDFLRWALIDRSVEETGD